jgi:hypothetical protein
MVQLVYLVGGGGGWNDHLADGVEGRLIVVEVQILAQVALGGEQPHLVVVVG